MIPVRGVIEGWGWPVGTSLENRIALQLHRLGVRPDAVRCQYRMGRYRIDFAFVPARIALEADGPWHGRPDVAARDAERDKWLRTQGWLILRVNDAAEDDLAEQLCRVVQVVNALKS